CLLLFASTRDQRRTELCLAQIDDACNARAFQFLVIDDLFGERQTHPAVLLRPGWSAPAMLVQRSKPAARFFAAQTAKRTSNVLTQMRGVVFLEPATKGQPKLIVRKTVVVDSIDLLISHGSAPGR